MTRQIEEINTHPMYKSLLYRVTYLSALTRRPAHDAVDPRGIPKKANPVRRHNKAI